MMRDYFEQQELRQLSPLALLSSESRGRVHAEPLSRNRTAFQRDRDRIIHSKAFRRLMHKTQVFIALESDHYRSRLTHSIEVAQISRHLARLLRLNEDAVEAIALGHDLGHTPFGHAGERVLNELMSNYGGFEHNQQSLRVVDELETKYPNFNGLNLTFEIRDGLKKHDRPDESDILGGSLEGQITDISDQIAYNNHDLDDALSAGLLTPELLSQKVVIWKEARTIVESEYANLTEKQLFHLVNSALISTQVDDVFNTTSELLKTHQIETRSDLKNIRLPLVRFSREMAEKNRELRTVLFHHFYFHPSIAEMNKRGQTIVEGLFNFFMTRPDQLPDHHQARIGDQSPLARVVCDYVSGMTDVFAQRVYAALIENAK